MRLLMVSGDRQVTLGERGPFHAMQRSFSTYFERIDVLCPRPAGTPTVFEIHGNVHFHPAPVGRLGMTRWIAKRGVELVREHGHALIVSHDYGWFYNGRGAARVSRATGVPYLSEIHHVPGVPVAADRNEVIERWVARLYLRWARSRALAFRVVNEREMPAVLTGWGVPADKVRVVPSLYIDLETFQPDPDRAEGGEPPGPEQDLVFVGRLVGNKGLDRIVDAMGLLAERGSPVSALFVGRGPEREALHARAQRRGVAERCRFVEWLDAPSDVADAYRASRVVVCASTCEGGPRFTVEAMACGVPAVSTPVGVMPDLLQDGAAGRLCDFTASGLADALGEVLGDEERRRAMGRAARAKAEPFEYERTIAGYAQALKDLAGQG